jgi:hypothetical protein
MDTDIEADPEPQLRSSSLATGLVKFLSDYHTATEPMALVLVLGPQAQEAEYPEDNWGLPPSGPGERTHHCSFRPFLQSWE